MIYYNTELNILGILQDDALLILVEASQFMVYTYRWVLVGEL